MTPLPPPMRELSFGVTDAASSPGVDVYVLAPGSTPSGTATISNMSLPAASSYLGLTAGTYDVYFTVSASLCPVESRPCPVNVLYHTTITIGANQNRTLVLLNDCNAGPNFCDQNTYTSIALADLN